MNFELILFIVCFFAAMLWYRILFALAPVYFKRPLTRSTLKLRWHHLHWGILLILSGVSLFLLSEKSSVAVIFLGVGLGRVIDLFIPSLMLETDRMAELAVYKKSFIPTFVFFLLIAVVLIALSKFL